MAELETERQVLSQSLKERKHLEDTGANVRVPLNFK
jgi:hypothetical protein